LFGFLSQFPDGIVTLVTFGSYRLRAYRPDADLDVLALCTPICTRGDFFTSLVKLMEAEDAISDIHPIPGAFTPVIKLSICSIQVDLLFGRVNDDAKLIQHQKQVQSLLVRQPPQGTEDNEYVIDDFDLQGLDESGVRSMNGVRVTQYLLNVVPNVEHFRVTLCAVKSWASIHGIYSNVLGFLGGINYAIMVAWVCRRYPNHYPTSLLRMFFRVFAVWEWPLPVTLAKLQCEPPTGVAWMPVWNPDTNPRDKRHLMPIITPVFPCSELYAISCLSR
jgi:poly(A) polymerase